MVFVIGSCVCRDLPVANVHFVVIVKPYPVIANSTAGLVKHCQNQYVITLLNCFLMFMYQVPLSLYGNCGHLNSNTHIPHLPSWCVGSLWGENLGALTLVTFTSTCSQTRQ